MFRSRLPRPLVLLVLLSLILAACGSPAATPGGAATSEAAPSVAADASAAQEASEAPAEASPEAAASEAAGEEASEAAAAEPTAIPTVVPAADAVVIEYWEMDWGLAAPLQLLVNDFNTQNPGIHVNLTLLSWGDYTQKFLGAIAAGSPPDISGGDGGMPYTFNAQGQILAIDELYEKWKADGRFDDLTEWGQNKWSYDGHYIGASWQIDARAIYYRKDLFEQAGIQPPTTHDELLAAATQLTDKDAEQYGICVPGKQGSYDTDQFYMTLVLQNGGGLADPEGNPTFDTPEHLEALKFEKELVDAAAPPGTAGYDFGQIDQLYQQGKCAMIFQTMGYATPNRLAAQAPEIYENTGVLAPLKGRGPNATQRIVGFYNPWMIYNQSEHPQEAMQFLDFLMQPDNLRKVYATSGGAHGSVYKSLREDELYQESELTSELAAQVEQFAVDYWYPNNKAGVGIGSLGTGITDIVVNPVLAGARTPEDALKDAQEQLGPLFELQAQ